MKTETITDVKKEGDITFDENQPINNSNQRKMSVIKKFMTKYEPVLSKKKLQQVSEENIQSKQTDNLPKLHDNKINEENTFEPTINEIEKYKYLEDDELSRLEENIDFTNINRISILLYRINDELDEPFLEFFLIKKNMMYGLPEFQFDTKKYKNDETPLKNQSVDAVKNISNYEKADIEKLYKGFIENEVDNFVVVFGPIEMYDMNIDINKNNVTNKDNLISSIWGIVDEIEFKKNINGYSVENNVVKLFENNSELLFIKDEQGNPATIPYLLYLFENNNNVHYEKEEDKKNYQFIIEKTKHKLFGSTFLFSNEAFEANNLSKIKRYAVFINHPLYLFNETFYLSEFKNIDINRSIRFYENKYILWSIKNSDLFIEL
jgi:hypothetical protein